MAAAPGLAVKKRPGPTSPPPSSSSSVAEPGTEPSTDSSHRSFSFSSIKGRPWRSFSTASNRESDPLPERVNSFQTHVRRLSKQRPPSSSSSHIDPPSRRGSVISDDRGRLSLSTTNSSSLANATSTSSIGWETQLIGGASPLEPDKGLLKTKRSPYFVITRDYLVKMKSRADALTLLPALGTGEEVPPTGNSTPEPLLVIPVAAIVSVLPAEGVRSAVGLEVWWKGPLTGPSFCRSDFFFNSSTERNEQMRHVINAMRAANSQDDGTTVRHVQDVKPLLSRIQEAEEPRFVHRKPDIFPVVPRGNTRKAHLPKLEDATKKPQEGSAFYLVVGTYLCHLVEMQKPRGGEPVCRHKSYGLVTLENFKGEWIMHEERFSITFRDPFKTPITLELGSRYYRQIVRAFGKADRFLKPAWPQLWQSLEIFHVSGLRAPQYLVPKEDFGCFRRTLDAYLAAYRCEAVDWEINWKARFAPEFRLLPAKRGAYSPLQILAVLRALRYNDYFNSLSFRDVDLSVLHGLEDSTSSRANAAYLSRTGVALGPGEVEMLRLCPVLHQEFHALAFCSETIRQVDFRNCSKSLAPRLAQYKNQAPNLQFLAPVLNLLKADLAKCNWLLLGGNTLHQSDIDDLAETIKLGAVRGLDVSSCGLDDANLRDVILLPLSERTGLLQVLSIARNPGRIPAHTLPQLLQYLPKARELNLSGSIQAESCFDGSLLPFATLQRMERLEELDISGFKVDDTTLRDVERFLQHRSHRLDQSLPVHFHKLILNHCGITGTQAARLFHAIGTNHGIHLSLSGNPIEDGIDALAAAIRQQTGPAGLHLDLIEFKHEPAYLTLLHSLTAAKHLTFLSLAGTAPSSSSPCAHRPCSDALAAALHDLLARNTSLHSLDLSGFSGKLDDNQLPRGAGRAALAGLARNTALTHLRVRNQRLHDDAGALGRALARNGTLRALDVQENGLNLTSLRFVVDSLRMNAESKLVAFPLPVEERAAVWRTVLRGLQRTPSSVAVSAMGTVSASSSLNGKGVEGRGVLREEEVLLKEELERLFAALEALLSENRARLDEGARVGRDGFVGGDEVKKAREKARTRVRHCHQRSASSGLLDVGVGVVGAGVLLDEEGWPAFDVGGAGGVGAGSGSASAAPSRSSSTGSELGSGGQNALEMARPPVATGEVEAPDPVVMSTTTPYHFPPRALLQMRGSNVVGGMESPTDTLDPVSEVETPVQEEPDQLQVRVVQEERAAMPERLSAEGLRGEVEDDAVFRKMVDDFRAAGFEI